MIRSRFWPATGYTSTVTMDMTNLDGSVWRGQMTKTYYFYLSSTNTYGRMTVNASASLPFGLNYMYNLMSGNRFWSQQLVEEAFCAREIVLHNLVPAYFSCW